MTTMRRLLARTLLCCVPLFAIPTLVAVAQNESDSANLTSLVNTNAVQFHLVGRPGVSFVAPLSDASGLRFSVDVDLSSITLDGTTTRTRFSNDSVIDATNWDETDGETSMGVDLTIAYVRYVPFNDRIFGFAALGPVGGYSRYSNERTSRIDDQASGATSSWRSSSTLIRWEAGLRGALGLQAFLTPFISVLGEMQVSGTRLWRDNVYESRSDDVSNWDRSESSETGWVFDIDLVRLGVAVHF